MTNAEATWDAQLAAWRDRGDRAAFEALVRPWLPAIRRMIHMNVGRDAALFEEVQETVLIALMSGLRSYREESAFSTFLFTLVKHKAIDELRRRNRDKIRPE
jgi:RNA polymerase sigma factor (sigma-70 family)